ncbi:MAG: general secretion pathway protein GspB [Deltaproteobacteria bacterium]|nr:general secretion pathway protein GspB [Deltaproteobacteria bacterium]
MSSILDALKKAEQESTTERGAGTPWPAPIPAQAPYRQRSRRWWVPLGIVVGLCVSGGLFWKIRQPDITPPVDSMTAVPALLSPKSNHTAPSVAEAPKPDMPAAHQQQVRPSKSNIAASPRPAKGNEPASPLPTSAPIAAITPGQPEKRPLRTVMPAEVPRVQPSPIPREKAPLQKVVPTSESTSAPAEDPTRLPADSARTTGQPMAGVPDIGKFFRSDPRIDLQALVWAPEAAERFVVINNRLIKEGGSVDNIVVVRINPDDVLLAEGSDRWHEAFKVR